jgi:tryptophanyl-tRNA synthetase
VQPTGNLHLGNYLGAIVNFVKLQETHNCLYCVVDLHAITQGVEVWGRTLPSSRATPAKSPRPSSPAASIRKSISSSTRARCRARGAGLDLQLRGAGRLAQPHDPVQGKGRQGPRERLGGLYAYPVLMAADILVYRATHVPVGEDQKQHLELSRDIAQKFNNDFGDSIRGHGHNDGLFFPAAGAADHGSGDTGDELARRHQEDVEVGCVR